MGPLGRYLGLACDQLKALEVVLFNGSVVTADDSEYGESFDG
jgi:FAD/FMN-containing dehydrogenase